MNVFSPGIAQEAMRINAETAARARIILFISGVVSMLQMALVYLNVPSTSKPSKDDSALIGSSV